MSFCNLADCPLACQSERIVIGPEPAVFTILASKRVLDHASTAFPVLQARNYG